MQLSIAVHRVWQQLSRA